MFSIFALKIGYDSEYVSAQIKGLLCFVFRIRARNVVQPADLIEGGASASRLPTFQKPPWIAAVAEPLSQ
jgi:hypothetical protein